MSRISVNQLSDKQNVREVYRVSEKQMRPNRNGNLYLQFNLSDKSGTVGARLWNANEALFNSFENGDYLRIDGATQLFQGALQMIVSRIEKVGADEVDEAEFVRGPAIDTSSLLQKAREILHGMNTPELVSLADCFLLDDEFMDRLCRAPAGVKLHHAYPGGLLEHIVNMMDAARRIAPCYPTVDADLLVMGAFIHDLAKVDELEYDGEMAYSDEGQMIGHLVMGVALLDQKAAEAEKFSGEPIPRETLLRLKHMVVSHHGTLENGSPKVPMTMEAMALHLLDTLDSKIAEFERQIHEDPNPNGSWTFFVPSLQRKLFKGGAKSE